MSSERDIAIVGCAEIPNVLESLRSALQLAGEALGALLRQTGIERGAIDGLCTTLANSEAANPFWSSMVADALGLSLRFCQGTDLGGGSPIGNVARAANAIRAGQAEMVLCIGADAPTGRFMARQTGYREEFWDPLGYSALPLSFGFLSSAYAARHGLPEAGMARLAVAQRQGALLNDNAVAKLRRPLSEADYFGSRMIADPLRLLDCVMRCDGANAVLVTTTARARKLDAGPMVHPVAYRERINFDPRGEDGDMTASGFLDAGPAALADAGLAPGEVDLFYPYDDFFIAVILQLEQIGFCRPGEADRFLCERDLGPCGDFPVNTSGGQISAGQPGLAGGGVNLVEAVRQLRGEAGARQADAPRNAVVTGIGILHYARNWSVSNVLVLEGE